MFTGLIQDVGTVRSINPEGASVHLEFDTRLGADLADGDSLAVNGVCLTVTSRADARAVATAVSETLKRTNLGSLATGTKVNLEPALRVGDRLGGHLVQGHVDGTGSVAASVRRGLSLELTVSADPKLLRYMVEKGSITIDGVSLTVASLTSATFSVALIPHTLGQTTLELHRVGERVNLEVDILAKYVERMLGPMPEQKKSRVTEEWLRNQGF